MNEPFPFKRVFKFQDESVLALFCGTDWATIRFLQRLGTRIRVQSKKLVLNARSEHDLEYVTDLVNFISLKAHQGHSTSSAMMDAYMKKRSSRKPITYSNVEPKTEGQSEYLEKIGDHDIVFGIGPAGTGKTYLAVAAAIHAFLTGEVERIILTRPAVEAGESLGFLPGTFDEKVNPYLQPLFDALNTLMGKARVDRLKKEGKIEIAPLAYMRGRTLSNAFVLLDEAQNCTWQQLTMLLTRLGEDSRCIVTGDVTQVDLERKSSGLSEMVSVLSHIPGIGVHEFGTRDVVRHPLVAAIVEAIEEYQARKTSGRVVSIPR